MYEGFGTSGWNIGKNPVNGDFISSSGVSFPQYINRLEEGCALFPCLSEIQWFLDTNTITKIME